MFTCVQSALPSLITGKNSFMRHVLPFGFMAALVLALWGCVPTTSARPGALTISAPQDELNKHTQPYTVPWPRGSDGKLLEGQTIVLARVDATGAVLSVSVEVTSGYAALDTAAVEGVRRWHLHPLIERGVPRDSYARVPVTMSASGKPLLKAQYVPNMPTMSPVAPRWGQVVQPAPAIDSH